MEIKYKYNPVFNKSPDGPCKAGTGVSYTLQASRWDKGTQVFLVLIDDIDNSTQQIRMPFREKADGFYVFQATVEFETEGLFWYHFMVSGERGTHYVCKTNSFDVEPVGSVTQSFAQVVYKNEAKVDPKYRQGITYHIFVDRFKKSIGKEKPKPHNGLILRKDWGGSITKNTNDFLIINKECFGGDLYGITDKLNYIKSLGVSTIYLSPIFEASSYHKYDTSDFMKVDPMLGGDEAFDELVRAAKQCDIGIVLDGVFNHAGSDSVYFNKLARYDSVGAYQSQKSEYYDWFSFEKWPDKYSCWWDINTLPQFNEENAKFQKFFAGEGGVVEKHMKKGLLGFRLDVVDEISDVFLNKLCKRIRSVKKDALVLGEVWEDAATKIAYSKRRSYFSGAQLNSVMNYPLKNALINFVTKGDAEGLRNVFYMLHDHYPSWVRANLMNFLGTHDTKRILTLLAESSNQNKALQLLKIASAIQYCAEGVPSIFYGDEVGMQGGEAPFCRNCFPWGSENKELLAWYKKLGALRASPVFSEGESKALFAHNGVFVFERTYKNERVVIAANCGKEDFRLNLTKPMKDFETNKVVKDSVMLGVYQFAILL